MNQWMALALECGKKSIGISRPNPAVGAVVVKNGTVCATGQTQSPGKAHAEVMALQTAAENAKGADLYVTLEPCVMCAGAIGWAQIKRLVYAADDDKRGFSRLAPYSLHPKCSVSSGILESECRELMQSFFAQRRNS